MAVKLPVYPFRYLGARLFRDGVTFITASSSIARYSTCNHYGYAAKLPCIRGSVMDMQRKTILIVDDDEQVLIELERLLEDQGYNTTTAWSGRQALEFLRSTSFDFVLLDGDLPDLTRDELVRQAQPCSKAYWIMLQPQTRFRPESVSANSVCKWEHGAILSKLRECLSGREHITAGKRTGNVA